MDLLLFNDIEQEIDAWKVKDFSAENKCSQTERLALEDRYWGITEVTDKFNRQSVSYQLSKKDCIHGWLKYKEGFSAVLVKQLLEDFNVEKGDLVIDPFMGSGTTALVSTLAGINSIGYDILPMSKISISAKSNIYKYSVDELTNILHSFKAEEVPSDYNRRSPALSITEGAYPPETDRQLAYYTEWFDNSDFSNEAKTLIKLCCLNTLERISYCAKDGQYLRWDIRSPKMVEANTNRAAKGKRPIVVELNKGELPDFKTAMLEELNKVITDIEEIQAKNGASGMAKSTFIEGSSLFEMTKLENNILTACISSPPYCNRYDYTRTYALELAYLGVDKDRFNQLRQDLLSCTVENRPKIEAIRAHYERINRADDFKRILHIARDNSVLQEINDALLQRSKWGEINNKGVLKMVDGYFTELTFLFAELYRCCKKGAKIAFVNDNVRYAGEVIPVDFLTTLLAEQIGFKPIKVYSLRQQKGNSSQQMKKYGRIALRKSITIWEK
jgi:site-specific DNA-methyltransferase (cytosine-N4-specific)